MKVRDTFGTIFLVIGIVLFYFIGSTSIASELDDILHGPPLTEPVRSKLSPETNQLIDKVLPAKVSQLPYIEKISRMTTGEAPQSTNDDPFQQFNIIQWMGWALIIAALADIGTAYLSKTKYTVGE
ncbi:MAG: hypothetical protein ACKN9J_03585 [Holophagaceae bacterium]|jgi:hypothetical protein